MKILLSKEADDIRQKYIETFINTKSKFYENIRILKKFQDGLRYTGYLWECFKSLELKDESFCKQFLKKHHKLYVFWDLHSCENICIENYWKYPIDSVLNITLKEFYDVKKDLPEDIYVFDETFSWTIAFTHETDLNNNLYILFSGI